MKAYLAGYFVEGGAGYAVLLGGAVCRDSPGPEGLKRLAQVLLGPMATGRIFFHGRVDTEPVRSLPKRRRRDAECGGGAR